MTTQIAILLILLLSTVANYGQLPKEFVLVDEFGSMPCDDLLSRLDNLAYLATETKSSGLVVVYPDKNVFQTEWLVRAINNNSRFRRFPEGLISVIRYKSRDELRVELLRTTSEKQQPPHEVPLNYHLPNISTRTLVADDSLEIFKHEGNLDFFSAEMCGGEFSLDVLAKVLTANPGLSAEIVIYNRKSSEARKLSRLILDAAISENSIPKVRLKMVLGGRGSAKEWSSKVSAVEIWLLPNKRRLS